MATGEFTFAVNPDSAKQGVRISRAKYDIVRAAILENLRAYGAMTFTQLGALVEDQLQRDFDGSIMWYYTTVKLDLEARGEIHRLPNSKPQKITIYAE